MQTAHRRHGQTGQLECEQMLHIAIVAATDGVLFAAVETSSVALGERLAEFTQTHAPTKLWPEDSAEVLRLLGAGKVDRAVDLYFARVGRRWDQEFLHQQVVTNPPSHQ